MPFQSPFAPAEATADIVIVLAMTALACIAAGIMAVAFVRAAAADGVPGRVLGGAMRSVLAGNISRAELAGSAVGLAMAMAVSLASAVTSHVSLGMVLLGSLSTAVLIIDWEISEIPEELTWLLLFGGMLASGWHLGLDDGVSGAAVAFASMWFALWLIGVLMDADTRAGGDVAAAAAGGAWVGLAGVGIYLVVVSVIYVAVSAAMARRGHRWVPMGPALAAAVPLTVLVRSELPLPL